MLSKIFFLSGFLLANLSAKIIILHLVVSIFFSTIILKTINIIEKIL